MGFRTVIAPTAPGSTAFPAVFGSGTAGKANRHTTSIRCVFLADDLDHTFVARLPCLWAFLSERAGRVLPLQSGDLPGSLFVGIRCAVIAVELELAICAGINLDLHNGLFFVSAFDGRPKRQDRPCFHKQWNGVDGRFDRNRLTTMQLLVGPIVVPVRSRGEVHVTRGCSLNDDWGDEQSWSEHIFVRQVRSLIVIWEIHKQGTHEGCSRLMSKPA